MTDLTPRTTAKQYSTALRQLLPNGPAWPKDHPSVMGSVIDGLTPELQRTDDSACDLLIDVFPATTTNFVQEWLDTVGQSTCISSSPTLEQARAQIVARLTWTGSMSKQSYIDYAAALGYQIKITEWGGFRCGLSQVGSSAGVIASSDTEFVITVQNLTTDLDTFALRCEMAPLFPAYLTVYWFEGTTNIAPLPPVPTLSISDITLDLSNGNSTPGDNGGSGTTTLTYLSATGSKLVDQNNNITMLKSVSWYGMENIGVPMLLWMLPWKTITTSDGVTHMGIMDQVKALGFNSMRLTLCEDVTWNGFTLMEGNAISGVLNPDFIKDGASVGTSTNTILSIEILDKMVNYAGTLGLRIIFDIHCLSPNGDNQKGTMGKWYTTDNPGDAGATDSKQGEPRNEEQWIAAWEFLANRYKNNPTVCGFDLVNEPYASTWDDDPLTGWPAAAERCAARIHAINPDVLIIVEGVTGNVTFPNGEVWGTVWSGNLTGVRTRPISITHQNKVVYSPHEYNDSGAHDAPPWAYASGWPGNLPYALDTIWGYIAKDNIAPIWIGEFGGNFIASNVVGMQWITALTSYIESTGISWSYWAIPGGPSDGTGIQGIYSPDNTTLDINTVTAITPLLNYTPDTSVDPRLLDDSGDSLTDDSSSILEDQNG